jgi:hypothetical protein
MFMSSRIFKLLLSSGLGLTVFVGNAIASAQTGDVVVPTQPANGTSTTTSSSNTSTTYSTNARFSCQNYNGQYTVMYQPESQAGQFFAWATPQKLGGGWDEYKRCATIAERLESYRPDGLTELRTSTQNGYNVLCVTSESNPACRIVLTVPPGYDAYNVRNSVFQNLISADNGQQTIAVNTYSSRSSGGSQVEQIYNEARTIFGGGNNNTNNSRTSKEPVNLKPFLDQKDGGTGSQLKKGVAIRTQTQTQTQTRTQSGNRLNPRNFK